MDMVGSEAAATAEASRLALPPIEVRIEEAILRGRGFVAYPEHDCS
jgi:hypothetical protein